MEVVSGYSTLMPASLISLPHFAFSVVSDALANTNQVRINAFALSARLATMHANREYIETGGLIAYGANYPDLFRRRHRGPLRAH
jgi:hypothetical protein